MYSLVRHRSLVIERGCLNFGEDVNGVLPSPGERTPDLTSENIRAFHSASGQDGR